MEAEKQKGFGKTEQFGFYSEANREALRGLKEEREKVSFVFCKDD